MIEVKPKSHSLFLNGISVCPLQIYITKNNIFSLLFFFFFLLLFRERERERERERGCVCV